MRSAETTVRNPAGIHARPAALFVRTAARYRSSIVLENLDNPGSRGDAKSMLSVIGTKSKTGNRIRVTADGADEDAAIAGMIAFVDGGCGEAISG